MPLSVQPEPHRIAIAGPGRSGTSLLVKILKAVGFVTPDDDSNASGVHAGLESRIGFGSPYEVDKDPWLFEYAANILDVDWGQYRVVVIPIRSLDESSVSRSKNERVSRILSSPESDHWSWNVGGNSAGAALSRIDSAAVASVLAEGLWTVLEVASSKNVPVVLLHYPTFARDSDYLWERLFPFIGNRVTREDFEEAFVRIVDPSLVVDYVPNDDSGPGKTELTRMVDDLRERFVLVERERAGWESERAGWESERAGWESERAGWESERAGWESERALLKLLIHSLESEISLLRSESDTRDREQSVFVAVESATKVLAARHDDLLRAISREHTLTDSRLTEIDGQLNDIRAKLEHLFIVSERAAQPFYRKVGRVVRRLLSPETAK